MSEKIADDEWEWYIGKIFARLIEKVRPFGYERI